MVIVSRRLYTTPVFKLVRFFSNLVERARRVFRRRPSPNSSLYVLGAADQPQHTPSPIIFTPPSPTPSSTTTLGHLYTPSTATLVDEPYPADRFQVQYLARNWIEELVQSLYYIPETEADLRHHYGEDLVGDSGFTVNDLVEFAREQVPRLSPPPSIHSVDRGSQREEESTASSSISSFHSVPEVQVQE